jgi:hypothetical protein
MVTSGLKTVIFLIIFTLSLVSADVTHAQILKDSSSLNLIKKGIDYIYNFQFKEANEVCNEISKRYPGHPVVYLLNGMKIYWENFPLLSNSQARILFEEDLRNCIELCEKKYSPEDKTENLLANLCARGMLLLFFNDNNLSMEVIPLATSTYKYIRLSFDFTQISSDFFFFTGLYNYTREAYPEAYPIYKPLALVFRKGDKITGIKELQKAAKNSIILRAESFSVLSEIFLRFENDYDEATYYNKTLYELYPDNLQFKEQYIKNLLLINEYDEAEKLILACDSKTNNSFFLGQITIFNGIIKEKKYHDFKLAQELYINGIKEMSFFGNYGNEFAAYAYYGLSRISDANGDKNYKKLYRKLADDLADLKKVNFD